MERPVGGAGVRRRRPRSQRGQQGKEHPPFQQSPRGAVPTLQIPGDERHQHDQYSGDGRAHRATEIPTATDKTPPAKV